MRKIIPPVLVLLGVLLMLLLRWLWPLTPWLAFPVTLIGLLPLVGGLALVIQGSRLFSRVGTNLNTFHPPSQLVTTGLYHFSRNPMYLGMVMSLAGVALLVGHPAAWLIVLAFFVVADRWYIAFEERMMERQFGSDYAAYRTRVRRWL